MRIIDKIKNSVNRIRYGKPKTKEEVWADRLDAARARGVKIGDGTRLNCDLDAFTTESYLISIGKNCLFAIGVHFVTHDGGVSVLNHLGYFGEQKMDRISPIVVGDNVYIGRDALIMPGVHIGNNVVIGARSVVTHDIPDNVVAVGTPAKVIKTIDEYYQSGIDKKIFHPTQGLSPEEKKNYYKDLYNID